ncbi:MAG: amidinotransferase, partial [Nocardioides sp.]|nr:amidinotransferase [Nocardioides sp.]
MTALTESAELAREHSTEQSTGQSTGQTTELAWGRHYVAVEPTHFRIDYAINPFMDPEVQPDPVLAMEQ